MKIEVGGGDTLGVCRRGLELWSCFELQGTSFRVPAGRSVGGCLYNKESHQASKKKSSELGIHYRPPSHSVCQSPPPLSLTPALTHCPSSHSAQDEALRKLQRKLESLEGLLRQHPLARAADLRPRLEALLHKQVGAAAQAGGWWPPQQAGGWLQRQSVGCCSSCGVG